MADIDPLGTGCESKGGDEKAVLRKPQELSRLSAGCDGKLGRWGVVVWSAADEPADWNTPESALQPSLHMASQNENSVAALDHAFAERKLRYEKLASEGRGDLPSEGRAALTVGTLHLRNVEGGVSFLDGKA